MSRTCETQNLWSTFGLCRIQSAYYTANHANHVPQIDPVKSIYVADRRNVRLHFYIVWGPIEVVQSFLQPSVEDTLQSFYCGSHCR